MRFRILRQSVLTPVLLILGLLGSLRAGLEVVERTAEATPREAFAHAIFAGGPFWWLQATFENVPGVVDVTAGYTGGAESDPSYEEVSTGQTSHVEAIDISYDPALVSYERLLELYWRNIDPTDGAGQLDDRGPQFRPVIFFRDAYQRRAAEQSRTTAAGSGTDAAPVAVAIKRATVFYPADEAHQHLYPTGDAR